MKRTKEPTPCGAGKEPQPLQGSDESPSSTSRRGLLRSLGAATAVTAGLRPAYADGGSGNGDGNGTRVEQSFQVRLGAALRERQVPTPAHPTNGDEGRYASRIGNFSKGLPHNSAGEVDATAYESLIDALSSGDPSDFEQIRLGGTVKLVNPQSGLAFDLEGTDCHQMAIPPAPAIASREAAAEAVELYWHALLRDVPFSQYATNSSVKDAADELTSLGAFAGPRMGGKVTPQTLFRGFTPGDLTGPYVSQFLLKPATFGAEEIVQQIQTLMPGSDQMTTFTEWLNVQNGLSAGPNQLDSTRRYIRNGRDLAGYVHVDVLFQAYFNACLILVGMNAPLNPGNPYNSSRTQVGFGTFGIPHVKSLMCEVATRALKAVWHQKWLVHRRLRPEEFGGLVHVTKTMIAGKSYPLDDSVLKSNAVAQVFGRFGSYLLPQAYAEGCPQHPSYGAGHATVAGACVTILKAFFDERFVLPSPVVASDDGSALLPYTGPGAGQLTAGGELNKVAANVAVGRNWAGIHWRTDYSASVALGEAIAISVLRDQRATYNESFHGFTFTKFDGTQITV